MAVLSTKNWIFILLFVPFHTVSARFRSMIKIVLLRVARVFSNALTKMYIQKTHFPCLKPATRIYLFQM